jgi:DNA-3-methyladenine glycosylase
VKSKILKPEFFDRNAILVAEKLLGKYLVREIHGKIEKYKIVETEAYEGLKDKASKAHRGQTPGNTPMFAKPGTLYVYFTYGMHWLLNVVCGKEGYPAAVLLRGVEGITGPARLTKKLGIDKSLNLKLAGKEAGVWFEEGLKENKDIRGKFRILKTPRIGIDSSGPIWSKKLYRFVLESK